MCEKQYKPHYAMLMQREIEPNRFTDYEQSSQIDTYADHLSALHWLVRQTPPQNHRLVIVLILPIAYGCLYKYLETKYGLERK